MPRTTPAVVARSKGGPVTLEEITIPDPGPGQVLVEVQACGVCHTDLHLSLIHISEPTRPY